MMYICKSDVTINGTSHNKEKEMKKVKNLLVAAGALLIAAVMLTSCNFLAGSNAGTVDLNKNGQTRTLTLSVTNYGDCVRSARSATSRAIMADMYENGDSVKFWLFGTANDGEIYAKGPLTLAGPKNGDFEIEISPKNWNLTLAAFPAEYDGSSVEKTPAASDVTNKAWLVGHATVDLSRWAATAKFTLTTDNLKTPATVAFAITLPATIIPSEWDITAGLYNISTGTKVKAFEGTFDWNESNTSSDFTLSDVTPGYYSFMLTFSKTFGGQTVEYHWSDIINVLPGKRDYEDQIITNFMGTAPEAPKNVTVTYTDKTVSNGHYPVVVTWTDESKTEDFFEIEVADITAASASATSVVAADTAWEAITGLSTVAILSGRDIDATTVDFYHSPLYAGGSVFMNSTTATLTLDTGKIYAIRMRSANTNGLTSGWAYSTLAGFTGDYLNRFTFTYNKDGGSSDKTGTATLVEEGSYNGTTATLTLWDPSTDDAEKDDNLVKGGGKFKQWNRIAADGTKAKYDTASYTGYTDVVLVASYKTAGTWTIFDPKDRLFSKASVTSAWDGEEVTPDDGTITVTRAYAEGGTGADSSKNKLSFTVSESQTWDYNKIWMVVDGVKSAEIVPALNGANMEATVVFPCADLSDGAHDVTLIAEFNGANKPGYVSSKYVLVIENN